MQMTLSRKENRMIKSKLNKSGDMIISSYFDGKYLKQTSKLPKFGETDVLTPNPLVTEMWTILMKQFKNNLYNIKVLDPSCGRGPFLVKAYEILFNEIYSDVEDLNFRNKLCIDSLYGFDIDKRYVNVTKLQLEEIQKHYGATIIVEPNVKCANFLNIDINMKFDVIIGNPPYQSSTKDENKSNAMWVKFGDLCSKLLNENGYMCLVHPDSWLSHPYDLKKSKSGRATVSNYRSRILSRLNPCFIWFGNTPSSFFKEATSVSIVLFKNGDVESVTIKADNGSYTTNGLNDFAIPKTASEIELNIYNKLNNNYQCFNIIRNDNSKFSSDTRKWEHISTEKDETHIYPICNTSAQYSKDQYLWSSVPHTLQHVEKVIFSDSGYIRPFYDSGKFGLSSHAVCILTNKSSSKKLIEYLNSNELKYFSQFYAPSGSSCILSSYINKIPKIDLNSDLDILSLMCNVLKLNSLEKDYIKNAIK